MHRKQNQAADNFNTAAFKHASTGNKNVLVIFHASWCGWCHKMDSSILELKYVKTFF